MLNEKDFGEIILSLTNKIILEKGKNISLNEYMNILDEKLSIILAEARKSKNKSYILDKKFEEYKRFIEKIRDNM